MTLENLLSVPFGKTTTDAGGRVYRGPGVPDDVDLEANIRWDITATRRGQQAEQGNGQGRGGRHTVSAQEQLRWFFIFATLAAVAYFTLAINGIVPMWHPHVESITP